MEQHLEMENDYGVICETQDALRLLELIKLTSFSYDADKHPYTAYIEALINFF